MKSVLPLVVAVMIAAGGMVSSAYAETMTVTGEIRDQCRRVPGEFTVPAGATASKFRLTGLGAGSTCTTNQPIAYKGFTILNRNFDDVYRYQDDGSLASLVLQPGKYYLSVDGGVGAWVTLVFEVK